jgi:hypothetical protein
MSAPVVVFPFSSPGDLSFYSVDFPLIAFGAIYWRTTGKAIEVSGTI